jgi:hypothetical protein
VDADIEVWSWTVTSIRAAVTGSCLKWKCSLSGFIQRSEIVSDLVDIFQIDCLSNAICCGTIKIVRLVPEADSHDQNTVLVPVLQKK